ncbi:hypothetical protein R5R35_012731 [Gryllus longicercus]|uniref:EF-hand domain-containing protein n=1 Tax=Gryllus longicercus TaxID=2509291 RepID=A0AAN9VTV6_9ORTH
MNSPSLPSPPPPANAEPPPPPQLRPRAPASAPAASVQPTAAAPGSAAAAPFRLQVAAAVTRYQPCTVDPRPGRAVHCPDLNACLVNEGRPVAVDCNAVHFGYAIPVSVVPLPHEPDLAELVLDPSPDLTPRAVSFLLRHHPQLRQGSGTPAAASAPAHPATPPGPATDGPAPDMAAAARHEPLRGRKFAPEPDEDIAAIAKQISDHAEAIYQTWKSRGLAPTEILTCHSNASAADKFGSALTPSPPAVGPDARGPAAGQPRPQPRRKSGSPAPGAAPAAPPSSLELLAQAPSLDANNLEKLVSTFVSEDKARLAAQRQQQQQQQQGKALPSSIQFALQKFEKQQQQAQSPSPAGKSPGSYAKQPSPTQTPASPQAPAQPSPSKIPTVIGGGPGGFPSPHHARSASITGGTTPTAKSPSTPSAAASPFAGRAQPQPALPAAVQLETIETYLPPDLNIGPQAPSPASTPSPATPKRTPGTPESPSGLVTWPLKGKVGGGQQPQPAPPQQQQQQQPQQPQPPERQPNSSKFATMPAKSKENAAYMAEVAREEERLINALKTGIVIAEEQPASAAAAASPSDAAADKKSQLLLKKSKEKAAAGGAAARRDKKNAAAVAPESPAAGPTPAAAAPAPATPTTNSAAAATAPAAAKTTPSGAAAVAELDKANLSSLSLVDFAKARYRSAQARPLTQQRLDDARQLRAAGSPAANGSAPVSAQHDATQVAAARRRFQAADGAGGAGGVGSASAESPLARRGALKSVPHPELTTTQRQHLRDAAAAGGAGGGLGGGGGLGAGGAGGGLGLGAVAAGANPVRPFLTRGSVAERVLIFEKCPAELLLDKPRAPALATWRAHHAHDAHPAKAQNYARGGAKESARPSAQAQAHAQTPTQPQLPPNTTLQRHVRAHRNLHIPRFYFPKGKPSADQQQGDQLLQRVAAAFRALPNQQAPRDAFHDVVKACDCPLYWKIPLFIAAGGEKLGYVEANSFIEFWKTMSSTCHDAAAQFFYILSKGQMRDLTTEDFIPMVQDVVDTHPGLTFLKEATEFHSRYVHTVITRIFYCVNRSWSGKISLPELRRSDLLRIIRLLEEEEDINQVTAYFSYEHFYVIYCKFWELDRDHDLYIDRQDLARHSDHALSTRMIDRIFSGAVTRGGRHQEEKMSYTDFVWFLLSEEDKRHPTAIEYWFRCMDLDGDGYLSMYELEYFYEEQLQRMDAIGIETLPFEDCLCQMLDMIHPAQPGKISLSDLKRCKMTPIFFDTFFNLEKYLDHEQRDPFASQRDHDNDGHELSDWDRYAADEYELLVAEEGGNDQQDDQAFDNNADDALSPNLDILVRNGTSSSMVMELDLEEDGCMEESPSSSTWRNNFNIDTDEVDEDSDNSADYAADSDECPV